MRRCKVADNKIYGEHYLGIPVNPPYQNGVLKRNPRGEDYPMQAVGKDGKTMRYSHWEREYNAKPRGRPKKYETDEDRRIARREYSRRAYLKKKQQRQEKEDGLAERIRAKVKIY